jgi:outer membrane immunogenic protein
MRIVFAATATVAAIAMTSIGANAADLPARRMPAPAPVYAPPPSSWAGFYVGGNLGGASTHTRITDDITGASLNTGGLSGFIGGGQLGYNFQTGNFVWGGEWTFDWASLERTSGVVSTSKGALQATFSTPWITTLAARFGYAWDRYLLYGKVGGGWVDNKLTVSNLTSGLSASATNSNAGLLLGVGGEWALYNPNWTFKIEYDHIGLDTWHAASPIAGDAISAKRNVNMIVGGFNYKFQGSLFQTPFM